MSPELNAVNHGNAGRKVRFAQETVLIGDHSGDVLAAIGALSGTGR